MDGASESTVERTGLLIPLRTVGAPHDFESITSLQGKERFTRAGITLPIFSAFRRAFNGAVAGLSAAGWQGH